MDTITENLSLRVENEDKLVRLEKLANQISSTKQKRALGSELDKAIEAVKSVELNVRRLKTLSEFTSLVRNYIQAPNDLTLQTRAKHLIQIGHDSTNAVEVNELNEVRGKIKSLVPVEIETIEQIFVASWKNFINREFLSITSLGKVLVKISETQQLGEQMNALAFEVNVLANDIRSFSEQSNVYENLKTRRDDLLREMNDFGAGQEVEDFLLFVADDKATLAHITPTVHKWLISHKAVNYFRVSL